MGNNEKMGLNSTWSMAVGGMVGGGIFSVLGVTVKLTGNLAWLSFIIAGLIALATAISYSTLTISFKEGGGVFTYIKNINHKGMAGGLSWLLIMGYILTMSVYAFTFGHYLAYVFNIEGSIVSKISGVSIILILVAINLRGVGEASFIEIITVWGKLIILLAIAWAGLQYFEMDKFIITKSNKYVDVLTASASIFMAYEGFQLITYDYNDIRYPDKTIYRAEILAVIAVILVYVFVSVGTILLVGQDAIIQKKEVAIAIAGKKAFGLIGLIIASIGALFSTGSAINSTLFATARLANKVAEDKELPKIMRHKNSYNIPDRAVIIIGGLAAVMSILGSLSSLVEGASIIFLITFAIVNWIALFKVKKHRIIAALGMIGAIAAAISLIIKFIFHEQIVLIFLGALMLLTTFGRKLILKKREN